MNGATHVNLSPSEMMLAAHAGVMRQVENKKLGRKPFYGAGSNNDWQLNIEGCAGEYALAKYLGVHWSGKGEFRAPDVGVVDVRTTTHENGRLILHPDDPDDRVFWLVTGRNGDYIVRGWILGLDGKKEEFWSDPSGKGRSAFFIPQSALSQRSNEGGFKHISEWMGVAVEKMSNNNEDQPGDK